MINLNIKDIQHLQSVIKTMQTYDITPLNLYCSQSFYDQFATQFKNNSTSLDNIPPLGSTIEVYIKPQIPMGCAVLQGKEIYLLKFTE